MSGNNLTPLGKCVKRADTHAVLVNDSTRVGCNIFFYYLRFAVFFFFYDIEKRYCMGGVFVLPVQYNRSPLRRDGVQ